MKTLRKPLFWILILFLLSLVCCAAILGGYIIWGQPLVNQSAPEPTPVNDLSRRATVSAYEYQMQQYYQKGDMGNWMVLANKALAVDPNNSYLHFYRARTLWISARKERGLLEYMGMQTMALQDIDTAISIGPKANDYYAQRALILYDLGSGYPYRADREYYYRLALDNIKLVYPIYSPNFTNADRYRVSYEVELHDCDDAMADTARLAATISPDDTSAPTVDSLYESAYACQGNYQKAYEYHQSNLLKLTQDDNNLSPAALYLYQMGKLDEALDLTNKAIKDPKQINGSLYFLRAAIEYDQKQYAEALQDAQQSENNSWAAGTSIDYFEGLEAARLGRRDEAISKLQYAEATLAGGFDFAIQRCRAELKKLGAEPLEVTPSVHFLATPMAPVITPVLSSETPTYSTETPTQTLTPTGEPPSLPVVMATEVFVPKLTPAVRSGSAAGYQLASRTADQADEIITTMEQVLYHLSDEEYSNPPYRPVWYAAWDALAHFPNDTRVNKWRWKMAYYMALSGDGKDAAQIYSSLINTALNQQGVSPKDLPEWFQSGELNPDPSTPTFTLAVDPMKVPDYDAGFIVTIGKLTGDDTPGGTCMLVVNKGGKFSPYIIYNGFPNFNFSLMDRNFIGCQAKDVNNDGVDEIVVDQYIGGHAGTTYVHVFDVHTLPPKEMPFTAQQDTNFGVWDGNLNDYPTVNGKTQIQIYVPLGTCSEYGVSNYQWNGAWFDISSGQLNFDQSNDLGDDTLFKCSARIKDYAQGLNFQDAISVLDNAFKNYLPGVHTNLQMLEEFRIMKGIYSAYNGDLQSAQSVFTEIVNSPTVPNSVWVKPAQGFLDTYKTSADLYRACPKVNICAPYYGNYYTGKCVDIQSCDMDIALQATVANAFSSSPLHQITDNLKSAGVHVLSEGWYDFEGDQKDEPWTIVAQPGGKDYELWIAAEYSRGVKMMLVGHLPGQKVQFKTVKNDSQAVLTDFGTDQTIEIVRRPDTDEPFAVVRDETVDPVSADLAQFKKLRQRLYLGEDPASIYESLRGIDAKYKNCPFETTDNNGETTSLYDCDSFYYTLAFAAEQAGRENEAVSRYYNLWGIYSKSRFADLVSYKLVPK